MEIVIRQPSRDLIKFLLDKAPQEGFALQDVRLTPEGLFLPIELADVAGLLDHLKTPPPQEVTDDKPKRATPAKRAGKRAAVAGTPGPDSAASPPEEDPWA